MLKNSLAISPRFVSFQRVFAFFTNSTTDSVIFERHGKVIVCGLKLSPDILMVSKPGFIIADRLGTISKSL